MPVRQPAPRWHHRAVSRYPSYRPRRLRASPALRRAFAETDVLPRHLIAPLFVKDGLTEPAPIESMPGHVQHSLESVVKETRELAARGVGGVIVFGVPAAKDPHGRGAVGPNGIAQRALEAIRGEAGDDLVVIADLCLCSYTDHGHCGLLSEQPSGRHEIDNDATIRLYAEIASSQARAGAHMIAPSGMMDGQVGAIRAGLDGDGWPGVAVMSYAVKYASSFYGPFRQAAEGAPQFGDRRSYQQDPSNAAEALREAALDVDEGADALMVKPALAYLDVVAAVKERFGLPVAAYNVSGEFSMLLAAAQRGWIDEQSATTEVLTSIRRAGADLILTYHAKKAAEWLA